MKDYISNLFSRNASKIIASVFLFCYFGFIIIPEWFHPISFQFALWLFALPIVLIALIVTGFHGGVGLWREKVQKTPSNPDHKFFVWLACLSVLWFFISYELAGITHFAYNHQEFDSEKWKSARWQDGNFFELSPRGRMFDDLVTNVLPGRTKTEVLDLLGKPNEQREIEGEEALIYYYGIGIMDPDCLIIKFDDNNNVRDFKTAVCG
jgi:hypothetical protein